jgi:hypothetical protein
VNGTDLVVVLVATAVIVVAIRWCVNKWLFRRQRSARDLTAMGKPFS